MHSRLKTLVSRWRVWPSAVSIPPRLTRIAGWKAHARCCVLNDVVAYRKWSWMNGSDGLRFRESRISQSAEMCETRWVEQCLLSVASFCWCVVHSLWSGYIPESRRAWWEDHLQVDDSTVKAGTCEDVAVFCGGFVCWLWSRDVRCSVSAARGARAVPTSCRPPAGTTLRLHHAVGQRDLRARTTTTPPRYIVDTVKMPSVLWRCWLGGRKCIRPVKNYRVVVYWHGYLSGARCRLAYGPADATATRCLLLQ